jgi:putative membrane protein
MTTTSSERRLHPVSVVFGIGQWLPRFLVPFIVLLLATGGQRAVVFGAAIWIVAVAVISVTVAVLRYLRFSYRYDAAELVIRSGIITRNERSIPYVRIQNLDAAQNPLHRLFDVAVVHVQTGGGAEPEATLRVLPTAALREMRSRVLAAGGRAGSPLPRESDSVADTAADSGVEEAATPREDGSTMDGVPLAAGHSPAAAAPPVTLLRLVPRELVLAGFIENRGMVLIIGALALIEQTGATRRIVERLFQTEDAALAEMATRWLGGTDVPVVVGALYVGAALLVILLFIRLLSTVWAMVRLYDFRLHRVGDELQTEYGLFTRVTAAIPLRRIQTVIIHDGLLHRLLGRRAVEVATAGGSAAEPGARQREPIAPIIRLEQLPALLEELQPGLGSHAVEWQPVHARAFGRMLRGSLFWPLAITAAAVVLVQEWAIAVFALLFIRAVARARLRARHLAWSLTDDSIIVRDGALTRATRVARFNRVQVVALDRNPFDLRTGMAGIRADTAGVQGGIVIPYLPTDTAAALRDELAARTGATEFTW